MESDQKILNTEECNQLLIQNFPLFPMCAVSLRQQLAACARVPVCACINTASATEHVTDHGHQAAWLIHFT